MRNSRQVDERVVIASDGAYLGLMRRLHRSRSVALAAVASAALVSVTAAWAGAEITGSDPERAAPQPVVVPVVGLPAPRTEGDVSLEQAILRRGSIREFSDRELTDAQLGQLLWAAQGERADGRTAPSAGGLHPLELYVVRAGGVAHYRSAGHEIALESDADVRTELAAAALDQRAFHTAPAVVVVAGVTERMAVKYGSRAERYVLIEVGHAAQNLLLEAAVLGLGAVPTGAFHDDEVSELLGFDEGTQPWYLIPIGHPA
jgi:SagB-type dehydrogenase family enzyme